MTSILAIDPGSKSSGWALFRSGVLTECGALTASRAGIVAHKIDLWFGARPGLGRLDLAVERAPVTSRRDHPADLYMPGLAAGLWIERWHCHCAPGPSAPDPLLIPVREWREGLFGPAKRRPIADPKALAVLYARDEWKRRGVVPQCPASREADAAEAVCLGLYVLRGAR